MKAPTERRPATFTLDDARARAHAGQAPDVVWRDEPEAGAEKRGPVAGAPKASEPAAAEAPVNARTAALEALRRVARDEGFAKDALELACTAAKLSPKDRALASELCYGVLRYRATLDWALAPHVARGIASVAADVLDVLRLGAYQLVCTRVPPHAAVSETVALARNHTRGGEWTAPFVNAVLRGLSREGLPPPPPPERGPVDHLVARFSFPRWLAARVLRESGFETACLRLDADNVIAPLVVRANRTRTTRDALVATLAAEGVTATPTPRSADGLVLEGLRDVGASAAFAAGLFTVQDEASQLVVDLCAPRPTDRVLDLCAAPGGKATALAERVLQGRVDAVDRNARKVRAIADGAKRLGLAHLQAHVADGEAPLPFAEVDAYDLVLVDAPCSGLGVLRRHPEAKWRVSEEDIARLAAQQPRLLANAARYVRPGGTLVYSVCTTTPEETEAVVRAFLQAHPDFVVAAPPAGDPLADLVDAQGQMRLWPHAHGTDGFFACRFQRASAR